MTKVKIFFLLLLIVIFFSCKKDDEFSDIPEIKFEAFTKVYNPASGLYDRGVLKFSFTDGDGDIGLSQNDTLPPYDYNLFITYYEIRNKDTVEVPLTYYDPVENKIDTLTMNARIPVLNPNENGKAIKGEIEDTLFIYNYNSSYDTILFEVYIKDKALNQSNRIKTPLIKRN